jgi:hypothetical protein
MIALSVSPDGLNKWKEEFSAHGCTVFVGGLTVLHMLIDIVTGAEVFLFLTFHIFLSNCLQVTFKFFFCAMGSQ